MHKPIAADHRRVCPEDLDTFLGIGPDDGAASMVVLTVTFLFPE